MSHADVGAPKHQVWLPRIAFLRGLRYQLSAVALVTLLLMIVAWSIDLAENYGQVSRNAARREVAVLSLLLPYLLYRAVDILTRLLPVACFIALFLGEILRRRRLDNVVLSAAGQSPLQAISSVLAVAMVVGAVQLGLEAWARPAAVFAQVDLRIGSFAQRFERGLSGPRRWFVAGDDAIAGRIVADDNPELRDVEIYKGFTGSRLGQVAVAPRAVPVGDGLWRLEEATVWERAEGTDNYAPQKVGSIDIALALTPQQLTWYAVPGIYLSNRVLASLRALPDVANAADLDMAVWRRFTAWLLPGAFALLGASLAQTVWSGRMLSVQRGLVFGLLGYAAFVSNKVFNSLGDFGSIPAPFAASLIIALTLAAAAVATTLRS